MCREGLNSRSLFPSVRVYVRERERQRKNPSIRVVKKDKNHSAPEGSCIKGERGDCVGKQWELRAALCVLSTWPTVSHHDVALYDFSAEAAAQLNKPQESVSEESVCALCVKAAGAEEAKTYCD